jgi:hypothetical protein
MALGYIATLRNDQLDQIQILVDQDVGAGNLLILDGARPATGGAKTTQLAILPLTDPVAPAAAAGVLTFSGITDDTATVAGTATWFRLEDNSGDAIVDGDVGTSGSDLNLNSVAISAGGTVSVTSFVITAGNP